jgi:tetratricopeptide (TPR) repeat protein
MQCPNCALYHPSRYSTCVSCGTKLEAEEAHATAASAPAAATAKQQKVKDDRPRKGLPVGVGIAIAGFILCASAGVTFFFLTKPPENERLLQEGHKQLQLGQYAFAVKTLSDAVKVRPNDAKAQLALARAYVGIDQIDKANECIGLAQQLGAGVVEEPALASDLANYYRQRNKYDRAVDLLRPLAAANISGKKAELADLDASWGDEAVRSGDYKTAMRCWEEVKDLHDGSRFTEAESRLATIYQKIGDEMSSKGDAEEALKYYSKLNVSAPSASSYEKTADLFEKQGKLELAIDQLSRAIKLSSDNPMLTHKLSSMMIKRGKELLDAGEADSGYGYLQKAQSLDPRAKAPPATVRNIHMDVDASGGTVHVNGEVWNPGTDPLNVLTLRAELFDAKQGKALWTKDQRVIDEFVPPLPGREARSFDMVATAGFDPKTTDLRVYLNGNLYKSYPLTKRSGGAASTALTSGSGPSGSGGFSPGLTLRPRLTPVATPINPDTGSTTPSPAPTPTPAPSPTNVMPPVAPNAVTTPPPVAPSPGGSAEEKTLKDLD